MLNMEQTSIYKILPLFPVAERENYFSTNKKLKEVYKKTVLEFEIELSKQNDQLQYIEAKKKSIMLKFTDEGYYFMNSKDILHCVEYNRHGYHKFVRDYIYDGTKKPETVISQDTIIPMKTILEILPCYKMEVENDIEGNMNFISYFERGELDFIDTHMGKTRAVCVLDIFIFQYLLQKDKTEIKNKITPKERRATIKEKYQRELEEGKEVYLIKAGIIKEFKISEKTFYNAIG